jgi:hypothetical protein
MSTKTQKLSDRAETGVALLVLVWCAALLARDYLARHEALTGLRNEALTSLLWVVPFMLLGWGLFALGEAIDSQRLNKSSD